MPITREILQRYIENLKTSQENARKHIEQAEGAILFAHQLCAELIAEEAKAQQEEVARRAAEIANNAQPA